MSGAIRTDLILSAEIMVIALSTVSHQGFWSQMVSLVVAFFITLLVYGVVALLIRMDDKGTCRIGPGHYPVESQRFAEPAATVPPRCPGGLVGVGWLVSCHVAL